ncbi:ATP-binding protein [Marinactinospora rubrisoli]|uniref:ATP-binding protein n=1 Tax=Marinactinospora rubrisoli TaxID=2715399 RepID=A0ABW2KHR5_9ACTN
MSLFHSAVTVGTFLGFSEGGMEFHADLVLPYRSDFQSSPMHGQFVLVGLEHDSEAVLGRITTISAHGRLVSPTGEDYAIRQQREDRPIPENLRDQYLKYRVDIRILGVLREKEPGRPPVFVPSHRRLPHVGAKVAFLSDAMLQHVAGATADPAATAELGFLALGEFVYGAGDPRADGDPRLELRKPVVVPRFDIRHLVSRRSFVFARAGFGKSNLVKLLFANLYGGGQAPTVEKRGGRRVPVGTVVFDPDGEYFWPDDKGRPGLCDVPGLMDQVVVFTDKEPPSDFYGAFVAVDTVKLDIRELPPARVVSLVIPPERQDQQNVVKLRQLKRDERWARLVDAVHRDGNATDLKVFYEVLRLKDDGTQDAEAIAARSNMARVVDTLHDPASRLLQALKTALGAGRLCIVDVSKLRGPQGLALAGVLLEDIFEHNQEQFTRRDSRTIPTIAVIEEAQSMLAPAGAHGEGPFVAWVKEGRKYDLGAVLITQQPGSISTELLSQGDNWFVFHLLAERDLRALRQANSHFSVDLLSSLLNEPIPGHGVFWSSAGERPYPIPLRALPFESTYEVADPTATRPAPDVSASRLRRALDAELTASITKAGGPVVTDGTSVDAVQTHVQAAIQGLRKREEFHRKLHSTSGIPWAQVEKLLSEEIPASLSPDPVRWIRTHGVVKRALNEILGSQNQAWSTEKRPSVHTGRHPTWIMPLGDVPPPDDRPRPHRRPGPPLNGVYVETDFDDDEPWHGPPR